MATLRRAESPGRKASNVGTEGSAREICVLSNYYRRMFMDIAKKTWSGVGWVLFGVWLGYRASGGSGLGEAVAIELTRQRPANPGIAVKGGVFGGGNAGTGSERVLKQPQTQMTVTRMSLSRRQREQWRQPTAAFADKALAAG